MGPHILCTTHMVWLDRDDEVEMAEHLVIGPVVHCRLVDTVAGLDVLDDVWASIPLARRLSTVVGP